MYVRVVCQGLYVRVRAPHLLLEVGEVGDHGVVVRLLVEHHLVLRRVADLLDLLVDGLDAWGDGQRKAALVRVGSEGVQMRAAAAWARRWVQGRSPHAGTDTTAILTQFRPQERVSTRNV